MRIPAVRFTVFLLLAAIAAPAQEPPPPPKATPSSDADRTATATQVPPDRRDKVYYPGDTERFKPLIHKLGTNVWLDELAIFSSPFRMKRKEAPWWLLFAGTTAALIATDHRTSTTFENSKGQIAWGNRISKIGASYTLIPLVAGFYGWGVWRDEPKPREVGVLGTEALIDGLITVEILKTIGMRNRPDSAKHPGKFFAGGTSFPSGHSVEGWALASLVAHEYKHTPWVPITAYSLAGVVSTARFAAQRHYASDIFAGAGIGWFIGRYVYNTHVNHAIHHRAWLNPELVPTVDTATRSYGITVRFGKGPVETRPLVPTGVPYANPFAIGMAGR